MKYGDLTYKEIRGWAAPRLRSPSSPPDAPSSKDRTSPLTSTHGSWSRRATLRPKRLTGDHGVQSLVLPDHPLRAHTRAPKLRCRLHRHSRRYARLHRPGDTGIPHRAGLPQDRRLARLRRPRSTRNCDAIQRGHVTDSSRAFLPGLPYHKVWCSIADPSVPGGHADSFTTSITLHLRPEAVRRDRIVDPQHKPVDWEDPDIDFASYSSNRDYR